MAVAGCQGIGLQDNWERGISGILPGKQLFHRIGNLSATIELSVTADVTFFVRTGWLFYFPHGLN
jgi:hypothetical protein